MKRGGYNALSREKWRERAEKIAELVSGGDTAFTACRKVAGYHCESQLKIRDPEGWVIVRKALVEYRSKRKNRTAETKRELGKLVRKMARERLIKSSYARNEAFCSLRACGWSLQSIGDLFGITREAVRLAILQVVSETEKGDLE